MVVVVWRSAYKRAVISEAPVAPILHVVIDGHAVTCNGPSCVVVTSTTTWFW